jgi:hypothetical protein
MFDSLQSRGMADDIGRRDRLGAAATLELMNLELINLKEPSETRRFEKGRFDVYHVSPATIGRATYEPGWCWSKHVAPTAGTDSCQVEHVGLVVVGRPSPRWTTIASGC